MRQRHGDGSADITRRRLLQLALATGAASVVNPGRARRRRPGRAGR